MKKCRLSNFFTLNRQIFIQSFIKLISGGNNRFIDTFLSIRRMTYPKNYTKKRKNINVPEKC